MADNLQSSAPTLQEAISRLNGKKTTPRPDTALAVVTAAAEAGDPDAMRCLTKAYDAEEGFFDEPEKKLFWAKKYYAYCEKNYKKKDLDYLLALSDLAHAHRAIGDPIKALDLYDQCYELRKEAFGETHLLTVLTLIDFAEVCGDLNMTDQELCLLDRAEYQGRFSLGKTHSRMLSAHAHMSFLKYSLNDGSAYDQLYECCDEIVKKRDRITPFLLTTAAELAMFLQKDCESDRAKKLCDVLLQNKEMLPPKARRIGYRVLTELGETEKAEALQE